MTLVETSYQGSGVRASPRWYNTDLGSQFRLSESYAVRLLDAFTPYEHGLHQLLGQLGQRHPRYPEALIFQQRLAENIAQARRYGDHEARRAERAEIVDRLNEETNAGLVDAKLKVRLADLGGTLIPGSPADFGKLIASETEKWDKVIRSANIKL